MSDEPAGPARRLPEPPSATGDSPEPMGTGLATGTPAPLRWGGHEGVPLTSAPLSVRGSIAYAMYAIMLNVMLLLVVAAPPVQSAMRAIANAIVVTAGVDFRVVAVAAPAILLIVAYGLILAPALVLARIRRVRFTDFVGLRRVRPLTALAVAGGVIVFGFGVTVLYESLLRALGIAAHGNAAQIANAFGASPFGVIVAFLAVAVVAPFVEEVTFRGIVFAGLRENWGEGWAILASGALFGIVHLDPFIIVPTALLGMALGKVFSSSRSLWASIVSHAAYNTLALALALGVRAAVR